MENKVVNEVEDIDDDTAETIAIQNDAKIMVGKSGSNDVVKSEGIKPENFDELPTIEVGSGDTLESMSKQDIEKNMKWGTLRYPQIDWASIENRRMFFAMLSQTFQEKSTGRGDKSYYASTYAWVDSYKKRDVTNLKNPTAKIEVPRINFKSPKYGVWFTFDLTDNLEYKLLQGKERGVFRLFMKKFDDDFRRIAKQQLEQSNKEKEKNDETVEKTGE